MRRARTATVVKKNISVIPANPEFSRDTRAQYKRLRVAAYCRVSTLQEQQETSYEAQVNYFINNSDYLQKARKYGHFTGYKN